MQDCCSTFTIIIVEQEMQEMAMTTTSAGCMEKLFKTQDLPVDDYVLQMACRRLIDMQVLESQAKYGTRLCKQQYNQQVGKRHVVLSSAYISDREDSEEGLTPESRSERSNAFGRLKGRSSA